MQFTFSYPLPFSKWLIKSFREPSEIYFLRYLSSILFLSKLYSLFDNFSSMLHNSFSTMDKILVRNSMNLAWNSFSVYGYQDFTFFVFYYSLFMVSIAIYLACLYATIRLLCSPEGFSFRWISRQSWQRGRIQPAESKQSLRWRQKDSMKFDGW